MAVKSMCVLPVVLQLYFVYFVTINAAQRFNMYEKKYIEDKCSSTELIHYMIPDTGLSSSIKIGATRDSWYSRDRNCTVEIFSSFGRGVILRIDSMYFGNSLFGNQCSDYIQVYGDRGNSTKLCGILPASAFVSTGSMKLRYYTSPTNSVNPGVGFNIVATVYQRGPSIWGEDQFRCVSGEYIWKGFACDGIRNCPDGSDENDYGESNCGGLITMRPREIDWNLIYPTSTVMTYRRSFNVTISAAIASAVLILVVGLIRFFCHYHCAQTRQRDVLRGIAIIRSRSTFPQNNNAPPPPYTSLVNEPSCNMPTNPPDYSSVVTGTNTVSCTAAASNTSQTSRGNQTAKQPSAAEPSSFIEPPPPYEP